MEFLTSVYRLLIGLLGSLSLLYLFVAYGDLRTGKWFAVEKKPALAEKLDLQINALAQALNGRFPSLKGLLERAFLVVALSALAISSYLLL